MHENFNLNLIKNKLKSRNRISKNFHLSVSKRKLINELKETGEEKFWVLGYEQMNSNFMLFNLSSKRKKNPRRKCEHGNEKLLSITASQFLRELYLLAFQRLKNNDFWPPLKMKPFYWHRLWVQKFTIIKEHKGSDWKTSNK